MHQLNKGREFRIRTNDLRRSCQEIVVKSVKIFWRRREWVLRSLMLSTKPMVQISLRKTYFSIFRCSLGRLNVIHRLLLSLHSLQISSWRVYHSSENYFRMVLMFTIYYYSDHYPPIDLVIQTGLVPRFTSFLSCDSCPELQYEAAWVLTNIASGNKDQVYILHLLNSRLQWWWWVELFQSWLG